MTIEQRTGIYSFEEDVQHLRNFNPTVRGLQAGFLRKFDPTVRGLLLTSCFDSCEQAAHMPAAAGQLRGFQRPAGLM